MKDRTTAMLLCLFLGGFGVHKFYLGKKNDGIIYLVFFWTYIPAIVAVFEFFGFCFMSDREFNSKFNNGRSSEIESASSYWVSRVTLLVKEFFSQTEVKVRSNVIKNKLDINNCSTNDLVHIVGLQPNHAENIALIRTEGYQFLGLEDLTDLADIPEDYCRKIEPLIAFTYYEKFANFDATNWQRLNSLLMPELIELELDRDVAMKICDERHQNGEYRALVEVKRRTGLPISTYKHLINASDRN
jgi:TM2 domain-containing membrane protein YozV/DNA-directed RNA polymerase subunit F